MKVTLDEKTGELVIRLVANVKDPPLSASEKNRVIATSGGNQPTGVVVNGQAVRVGVNAYYPVT